MKKQNQLQWFIWFQITLHHFAKQIECFENELNRSGRKSIALQ